MIGGCPVGGARFFYSSSRQVYTLWMQKILYTYTSTVPGKSNLQAQNAPYMSPVLLLRAQIHGGTCPTAGKKLPVGTNSTLYVPTSTATGTNMW